MVQVVGKDETQYREVTCKNCASRLRYVGAEIVKSKRYDYTGDFEYVYHITCPCCGQPVSVGLRGA